jgi:hypothetical protein
MKRLTRIALTLCAVLCSGWLSFILLQHSTTFITSCNVLEKLPWFEEIHYVLLLIVFIGWPYWIHLIGHYQKWDAALVTMLKRKRLWLMGFFLSMEIFTRWGHF